MVADIMNNATGSILNGVDFSQGLDIKTAVNNKYTEFMQILNIMSSAMNSDQAVVFPMFPNSPVKPSDAGFQMYANYSIDQLQQQIELLIKTEQFQNDLEKTLQKSFG